MLLCAYTTNQLAHDSAEPGERDRHADIPHCTQAHSTVFSSLMCTGGILSRQLLHLYVSCNTHQHAYGCEEKGSHSCTAAEAVVAHA